FVREGDWVRVVAGPFRGVIGIVVERRGRRRILAGLGAIGQGLEVDIEARCLEPIEPPAEEWGEWSDQRRNSKLSSGNEYGIAIYADGASVADMMEARRRGVADGFTTNPTLMAK